MRRLLRIAVALLSILPPFMPTIANAADFNLTASPLPVNLSVKPGGTVTTPLKVENTGTQTIKVKINLMKFKADGTTGKPEILEPSPTDDYIQWVGFSETSFQAEPNVWHTITMTIKTPPSAAFGYYYAVIFSQEGGKPQQITTGQHNTVNGAVATLVLLDVNAPGEKRTLTVKNFVSAKRVYDYLPATFNITVHNSGNVHAVPFGDIFISRDNKKDIATLELNKSGGNILPGTDRVFTVDWTDGFPAHQPKKVNGQVISDKNGKPETTLEWTGASFNKFRIGQYHAHLVLTYNDGTHDVPIEGDVSFWVVPVKLLLLALVVLLLALGGLYALSRSIVKRVRIWRTKRS